MLGGVSSFASAAPLWSSEGVDILSLSPSETDSEDDVFGTAPFCCCASGSFRTLTVPCESPLKILYPVLLMAKKESRSMWRISLWPFGSDCLSSILQCSACTSGFRFLIHHSSSHWAWAYSSLVLRATLTGLLKFLASVASSLAPDPSL
jgi:hypothetical protein